MWAGRPQLEGQVDGLTLTVAQNVFWTPLHSAPTTTFGRSENRGQWLYPHILKQVAPPAPCPAVDAAQASVRAVCCVLWGCASHLELGVRRQGCRWPLLLGLLDSGVGALPGCDISPCHAATDCSPRPRHHAAGLLPTGFWKGSKPEDHGGLPG